MKTIHALIITLLISVTSLAQNGINYKAVIKDGGGNIIANELITVQFNILETTAAGTLVYQENHTPTTDNNGIIIVNIGEGTPISGVFTDIAWASDTHFLNVQVNTGSGLVDMGTTAFKMVPYANTSSRISESPSRTLEIAGTGPQNLRLNSKTNNRTGIEFLSSGSSKDWKIETSGLYLDVKISDNDFASSEGKFTFRSNGSLGVNTISPATELDVNGTIRTRDLAGAGLRPVFADALGDLVVDTTPKTHYLSFSPYAFFSDDGFRNGSNFVTGTNTTSRQFISASVNLPDGSIIKKFKVYFQDDSVENIEFRLLKIAHTPFSGSVSSISILTTSGSVTNTIRNLESATLNEVVDNLSTSYAVNVAATWEQSFSDLYVRSVVITYELPD